MFFIILGKMRNLVITPHAFSFLFWKKNLSFILIHFLPPGKHTTLFWRPSNVHNVRKDVELTPNKVLCLQALKKNNKFRQMMVSSMVKPSYYLVGFMKFMWSMVLSAMVEWYKKVKSVSGEQRKLLIGKTTNIFKDEEKKRR